MMLAGVLPELSPVGWVLGSVGIIVLLLAVYLLRKGRSLPGGRK